LDGDVVTDMLSFGFILKMNITLSSRATASKDLTLQDRQKAGKTYLNNPLPSQISTS
jgi:hypothetical protein